MIRVLLVGSEHDSLAGLAKRLRSYGDVEISRANSGQTALGMISEKPVDLAVVDRDIGDMGSFEFVKKMVSVNPLINSAVVSSLSSHDFHEAGEGLGILMKLSPRHDEKEADELIKLLKNVFSAESRVSGPRFIMS